MEPKKVIINGIEYSNLEQIPEALRGLFADADRNGIPDILEGKAGNINWMDIAKQTGKAIVGQMQNPTVVSTQNFVVDGQSYSNLMDIPEPKRTEVIEKMKKLGQAYSGWTSQAGGASGFAVGAGTNLGNRALDNAYPAYEVQSSGIGKFFLGALAVLFLVAIAAAVVYFFILPQR